MVDNVVDADIYSRLEAQVRKVIKPASFDNLTPNTRLKEDLEIESIRLVELILYVESEFKIEIADSTIGHIDTIEDAVKLIKKEMGICADGRIDHLR